MLRSRVYSYIQSLSLWIVAVSLLLFASLQFWQTTDETHDIVLSLAETGDTLQERVHVNSASEYALRKAGFAYYEISHILAYREKGYYFTTAEELASLPHMNIPHLRSVTPSLVFDTIPTRTPYAGRHYTQTTFRPSESTHNTPTSATLPRQATRIPLFSADSAVLVAAGIPQASLDTFLYYRRHFVLGGSLPLDSFVSLTTADLATVVRGNIIDIRRSTQAETQEPVERPLVGVNGATVEELMTLRYVGRATAEAIVDYRDRLGGFVSLSQINEVYQARRHYDEIVSQLTIDSTAVRKVNVNSTNNTRFIRHPYLGRYLANRVYALRKTKRDAPLDSADLASVFAVADSINPLVWRYVSF